MALKVKTHPVVPVDDNLIMVNNKETVLLGAERVDVGVKTGETVIKTDPLTGFNYKDEEVITKTVYDLSKQKHNNWFVLDLETGSRGWYPGKKD